MRLLSIIFALATLIFPPVNCRQSREKRNILTLLDLIDDFCDGEERCINDVTDDLIYYVSEDPYDPQNMDAGASRMTVLLESLDDKCQGAEGCLEDLFEDLRTRVINNSNDYHGKDVDYDELFNSHPEDEENESEEDATEDKWEKGEVSESQFERYELKENLDETVINGMNNDECLQNREACKKFVEKEEKLGLNHIGEIQFDEDGEPVVFVPKSLIFREELRIPEGADEPEDY